MKKILALGTVVLATTMSFNAQTNNQNVSIYDSPLPFTRYNSPAIDYRFSRELRKIKFSKRTSNSSIKWIIKSYYKH